MDTLATRIVAANLTPALGVAIVMDGKTVFSKAYGLADVTKRIPADARTLWYLASTTKSYTGFGISLLAHQSVLRFDQSIASLLPGTTWHASVDPNQLTLARFLSHTSHLNDNAIVQSAAFTGEIPEARWPELLRQAEPSGNNDMVYSNFGYNVAAQRSEGWRRFLDSAVNAPAGLRETYTRLSGLDARRIAVPHTLKADGSFSTAPFLKTDATMNSAGGHVATLHDLARWTLVQMDDGMLDGKRVFPAEAVRLSHSMLAPHTVARSKRFAYFDREGWAAGWDIGSYEGEPMVSRFGSYATTRSHLSMLPRRRIGVVAQVDGRPGWTATDLIAAYAYDLEAGKPKTREVMEQRFQELHATRAAIEEGVVAGGGVALVRAQSVLDKVKGTEDEKIGVEIVRKALEEPLRMIAQNAGAEGSIVLAKVRESKDKNYGYNAQTEVYEDLTKAGVIDPTKVTRTALQNAASIAGLLLTTECVVVERKEEKPAPMGGPPGGGMGGMY